MDSKREELITRARHYGIEPGYWDVHGNWHETANEVLEAILQARGLEFSGDKAPTDLAAEWPPVVVALEASEVRVQVPYTCEIDTDLSWQLSLESGTRLQGTARVQGSESGPFVVIAGVAECGYHDILWSRSSAQLASTQLIVYPQRCYQVPDHRRIFGLSTQVYSACRTARQGIGTFADVRNLSREVVGLGGSFLGLNPLHALHPGDGSPYSPTSRIAFNVLYIDKQLAVMQLFLNPPQALLDSIGWGESTEPLIDYGQQYEVQQRFLRNLYQHFFLSTGLLPGMRERFENFCERATSSLRSFAAYEVLQAHFHNKSEGVYGWMQWPQEFRHPSSEAVVNFIAGAEDDIRYVLFGQWIAHLQLESCIQEFSPSAGHLGLYTDVALGVSANSADAWIFQDAFVFGVAMGAPPDAFNPQGQDWGLPPFDPERIRHIRYEPFIGALREAMRFAGAVRIDHVMSLFRLFWVLPQKRGGAYVRYHLEELFAIVALESQRHRCVVVGEDLGTVPDEVREAMQRFGVLSYKVVIFMRRHDGSFATQNEYPSEALVTVSTHDLPTIHSYMSSHDIETRRRIGMHDEETFRAMEQERAGAVPQLQRLFESVAPFGEDTSATAAEAQLQFWRDSSALFVASTPSVLCVLQLEDLALVKEQVNIPGTTHEHPNWSRKLPRSYEEVLREKTVQRLFQRIRELRD